MKASNEDTLGLFAPDPNQGPEDPGPTTGELSWLGKAGKLRLVRWARSTTASSQTSAFLHAFTGTKLIHQTKLFPLLESRG